VKNPLNPLIGETFSCKWEHPDSTSYYVAEQLSHHPPRTAFCFYDIKNGVAVNSNLAPSYVKFYGNSAETRIGGSSKIVIFTRNLEETYSFSFPTFLVRGILVGTLAMEMVGKVQCSCAQTGYSAEIEFKSKGIIFGKHNELVGKVKKQGQKGVLYTIHGFWDGTISITNVQSKQTSVFFEPSELPVLERIIPPLEEQPENSSAKVWKEVVRGILKGNEEIALNAKRKIEEVQRREEKEREEQHREWIPSLFKKGNIGTEEVFLYQKWNDIIEEIQAGLLQQPPDIIPRASNA